jgi:hypothetical protein
MFYVKLEERHENTTRNLDITKSGKNKCSYLQKQGSKWFILYYYIYLILIFNKYLYYYIYLIYILSVIDYNRIFQTHKTTNYNRPSRLTVFNNRLRNQLSVIDYRLLSVIV